MAFAACERVGCWHPDDLLAGLTWEQFTDWIARYQTEPWGEARADLRAAATTRLLLAPYIDDNDDLPTLKFPYFREDIDLQAQLEALAEYEAKYGRQWPRQSPNSTSSSAPTQA